MKARANRDALVKSLTDQAAGIYSVPMLMSGLSGFLQVTPWVPLVIGALGIAGSHFVHRRIALRLNRTLAAAPHPALRYVDESSIRKVIATANAQSGSKQAIGTLIQQLPGLESVRLIVGATDGGATDQARLVESLRDYAPLVGSAVTIDPKVAVISPWEINDTDPKVLRSFLAAIPADEGTWVDVTGGTVAMSLAVARAAEGVGHRVCYTASDRNRKPPVFYGVVEIPPAAADAEPATGRP